MEVYYIELLLLPLVHLRLLHRGVPHQAVAVVGHLRPWLAVVLGVVPVGADPLQVYYLFAVNVGRTGPFAA